MTKVTSNIGTQPLISNEKLEAQKRQIAMEQARFLQGDNPNLVGTVLGFTKRRGTYLTPNSPESNSYFICLLKKDSIKKVRDILFCTKKIVLKWNIKKAVDK